MTAHSVASGAVSPHNSRRSSDGGREDVLNTDLTPAERFFREQTGRTANLKRPLGAIRAKCLDCCLFSATEVRLCPSVSCPLWVFRFGRNPLHRSCTAATPELRAIREVCKEQWTPGERFYARQTGNRVRLRSPLRAIRAKCLDCSGYNGREARTCPKLFCALNDFRRGTDPWRKRRELSAEEKAKLVAQLRRGGRDADHN